MSVRLWDRPTDLAQAANGLRAGRTIVGGGAALASQSFAPAIGPLALDLSGLGLDTRNGSVIGAMVTLETLLKDAEVWRSWPALIDALRAVATPEVRRLATIGGSVAARLPTGDVLPVLCALSARIEVLDAAGARRWMGVEEFLPTTARLLVCNVDLGAPARGAYRRFAGRSGFAPALASVAGVRREGALHVWAGSVASEPLRVGTGPLPAADLLRSDDYATGWYRRRLLESLRQEVLDVLGKDAG